MRVLIDEDVPRAFGDTLKELGFEVLDVRDAGLSGASDEVVFRFAKEQGAVLLTGDLGFTNPLRFNLRNIAGILLNRLPPELSLPERIRELRKLLASGGPEILRGYITVLEVGRIRRRSLGTPMS